MVESVLHCVGARMRWCGELKGVGVVVGGGGVTIILEFRNGVCTLREVAVIVRV